MNQGYAKVTIYSSDGSHSSDIEYTATVRMVRPNGRTMAAYLLGSLYGEGYTGMTFLVSDQDDCTLEVANIGDQGIVVYLDYFTTNGNPWFQPPKSSQDNFTLRPGLMHTFSVKTFLEITP